MLLFEDGDVSNVLVGGIDELTDEYVKITKRMGFHKDHYPGEGGAFFVIGKESENALARIADLKLFFKREKEEVLKAFNDFVDKNQIDTENSVLVSLSPYDSGLKWEKTVDPREKTGEFMTASALAMDEALNMIESGTESVVMWNSFLNMENSFMFLKNV